MSNRPIVLTGTWGCLGREAVGRVRKDRGPWGAKPSRGRSRRSAPRRGFGRPSGRRRAWWGSYLKWTGRHGAAHAAYLVIGSRHECLPHRISYRSRSMNRQRHGLFLQVAAGHKKKIREHRAPETLNSDQTAQANRAPAPPLLIFRAEHPLYDAGQMGYHSSLSIKRRFVRPGC